MRSSGHNTTSACPQACLARYSSVRAFKILTQPPRSSPPDAMYRPSGLNWMLQENPRRVGWRINPSRSLLQRPFGHKKWQSTTGHSGTNQDRVQLFVLESISPSSEQRRRETGMGTDKSEREGKTTQKQKEASEHPSRPPGPSRLQCTHRLGAAQGPQYNTDESNVR